MNYFFSAVNICGGLALFLFGVDQSALFFRRNMNAGARELMARFTKNKFSAFTLGVVLSALTQSSTIATSFAVGFVDVGLLAFSGSLIVMMGASLGGTFVSFLLSLNLFDYAPLLFALSYFLCKAENRWVSTVFGLLKCLALIFLGMQIIGLGTKPLFADAEFKALMTRWASAAWVMGLIAFIGSGVFQSSSAIMALGIALAASDVLPATSALPIALGAHIGSTTMVVLAGMSGSLSAKRLGYATFFFKLIGGVVFLCVTPFVHRLFVFAGLPAEQELVYGQVLIATFNILLFLPFPELLSWLAERFVSGAGSLGETRYIDEELLDVPELAVMLLSREMSRLSNYMEAYLQMLLEPQQRDKKLFGQLPSAIMALGQACQEFAYRVDVPADESKVGEDFTITSYTMSILRGMSKLLCGPIRDNLESPAIHEALEERLGVPLWNDWCKLSRRCMRDSLRAFVIGEKGLVESVEKQELALASLSSQIRREVGESSSYDRNASRAVRLVSLMQGFISMAKEVAEGEEFTKRQSRQRAKNAFAE
ncbi:MAG: Na/Pi cotransporter family protein [Pyramidobacter sp.]|jgi:phosphate:Na+ symporter